MHDRIRLLRFVAAAALSGCVAVPPALKRTPAPPGTARPASAAVPASPAPAEIISDCGISRLRETTLVQINAARAAARSCGAKRMGAARPLVWSRALAEAAEQHSVDMAVRRYFEHRSPDGKQVADRVAAQGYKWRTLGENIAGGDSTVAAVMGGWLRSPEHCLNIMNPAFSEAAVACVRQQGSEWGTYWTMVLASRR